MLEVKANRHNRHTNKKPAVDMKFCLDDETGESYDGLGSWTDIP